MDGTVRTKSFIANLEAISPVPAGRHIHDRLVRKNQRTDQTKDERVIFHLFWPQISLLRSFLQFCLYKQIAPHIRIW